MNEKILEARELRYHVIKKMSKSQKIIISLKANTPGNDKNRYSSYFLIKLFNKVINYHFDTIEFNVLNGSDGPYFLYRINNDTQEKIKEILVGIENNHPLGRLIDLDLYINGNMVSRSDFGLPRRTCMICKSDVSHCMRNHSHSLDELLSFIDNSILKFLKSQLSILMESSMLRELNLEHKFGLVTPSSTGSHNDMDYQLMLKSKDIIIPYLTDIFELSFIQNNDIDLFEKAKQLGIHAEKEMLKSTSQINTYKGLIYLLGFVLMSLGLVIKKKKGFEDVYLEIENLAKNIYKDFSTNLKTSGIDAYLKHNITGIRGEVSKGLPTIQKAISIFSNIDVVDQKHQHSILLFFMTHSEDTVLLKRSGSIENYNKIKEMARKVNPYLEKDILDFTSFCIKNNLSFGGSADLFITFHFLNLLREMIL